MRLICADVIAGLRQLEPESVHMVVTSPPYFALRKYEVDGEMGLESHPDCLGWATGNRCGECHVCRMVDVFREVKRVLRKDGIVALNYGDSYVCNPNGRKAAEIKAGGHDDRTFRDKPKCEGVTLPPSAPCTVLDPFVGSGTSGMVALELGRSFIGIDIKPEYIDQARGRIGGVQLKLPEMEVGVG